MKEFFSDVVFNFLVRVLIVGLEYCQNIDKV